MDHIFSRAVFFYSALQLLCCAGLKALILNNNEIAEVRALDLLVNLNTLGMICSFNSSFVNLCCDIVFSLKIGLGVAVSLTLHHLFV